jgi:hypothetical protein
MPGGKYHRIQAQLFARLAVATSDPRIASRYNQLALEHLAKAEEVEPSTPQGGPNVTGRRAGSNSDRD